MKNSKRGFIGIILLVLIAILVISGGTYFYMKNKNIQSSPTPSYSTVVGATASSTIIKQDNPPVQLTTQCGTIDQSIFAKSDSQITETEKRSVIKALTCINQAIIKCSTATVEIKTVSGMRNVSVDGKGKLGCNVSVPKSATQKITCPIPSDYMTSVQKKFAANNYDGSIILDLMVNINAEINSGNKSGNCTASNI